MQILIVTNMYPTPDRPYLGIFVQEQERSLRALGLDVTVSHHVATGGKFGAYTKGLHNLIALLCSRRFDLIHSHHTYSTLLALAARRRAGLRIPIVETFHESEVFH